MIVVIDTSAFGEDLAFRGSGVRSLLAGGRTAGLQFIVPIVVVDELVGRFKKRVAREQKRRSDTSSDLVRLVPERRPRPSLFGDSYPEAFEHLIENLQESDQSWPELDELADQYRAWLEGVLERNGWEIRFYPAATHQDLTRRAIDRAKPFNEAGNGYRDALIWETALEILADSDKSILFVSENSKDFADSDGQLHPDLCSDLEVGGYLRDRVQLVGSIGDLLDAHVKPVMEQVNELALKIMRSELKGFDLYEDLFLRDDFLMYRELEPFDLDLEDEVETVSVVGVYGLSDVEVPGVRRLSNELVLVSASAAAEVEIDGTVFKSNYYAMSEHSPWRLTGDLNDHYFVISRDLAIHVTFDFTLDPTTKEVVSYELFGVSAT